MMITVKKMEMLSNFAIVQNHVIYNRDMIIVNILQYNMSKEQRTNPLVHTMSLFKKNEGLAI